MSNEQEMYVISSITFIGSLIFTVEDSAVEKANLKSVPISLSAKIKFFNLEY